MGLTNDIREVLARIRKLGNLPSDVYNRLSRRISQLEAQIKDIDLEKFGASIIGQVREIVEEGMKESSRFVSQQIQKQEDSFMDNLRAVTESVGKKFSYIESYVSQIPDYFQTALDAFSDHIIDPVNGFIHKYLTPLLVLSLIFFLAPILVPIAMAVLF